MTSPECPKITLVEALHDGRLGPQERASVERHLGSCPVCAGLVRDLERIGEVVRAPLPGVTPLQHMRARSTLLERAARPLPRSDPPPARPRPWLLLAAAMMALAGIAGVAGFLGGRLSATPERAALAGRMRRPPRVALAGLSAPAPTPAPVERTEMSIRSSADARFERSRHDGVEVVTLTSGAIDVTRGPLAPGERFVVRTGDAEIDVRGTAFRVEADRGRVRGVVVAEGTLEVRYAGFSAVIPSGGSWRATDPGAAPPLPPIAATPRPSAPARVAMARRAGERATKPPPVEESPRAVKETPPPAAGVTLPASSVEFAAAMEALGRGDFNDGVVRLVTFTMAHPDDARADEADYLQAIALQRAGRARDAVAAARRYLGARPEGAHRSDAQRIAGQ